MNYLIFGYILVGACYARATWIDLRVDPEYKELMAEFDREDILFKTAVIWFHTTNALLFWPVFVLIKLFSLLFRK
jgi:hypothetical protein